MKVMKFNIFFTIQIHIHVDIVSCFLHIQHNYFHIKQILILDKDSPSKYERFLNDYII